MYLSTRQHDLFRTLLMGFEIPIRSYIAQVVTSTYKTDVSFENAMKVKNSLISPSSPSFLKEVLPKACTNSQLRKMYHKFQTVKSLKGEIVVEDIEIPMVGALNLASFTLTEDFSDLYSIFGSYGSYCDLAEKYRYARNKLDHPGCRTLEDSHLVPVLSFVKDLCLFLDDCYFSQKTKGDLLNEVFVLQQRKTVIPVEIHNFSEMPYGESHIVCRDAEIQRIKEFIFGKPDDLRKQHSFCVYGYGGVGKTALVLEVLKQIVRDVVDKKTVNEYEPKYILFFSAKKRKISIAQETGKYVQQPMRCQFETAAELIELIKTSLRIDGFRRFKDEGVIVIDNLETLALEERQLVKSFVETQTPSEMQFILTSRNSEEYETNFKLAGFEAETGKEFITTYSNENALNLELDGTEQEELLSLAKGNTLVLVLSLRRLSQHLATVSSLKSEFSVKNAWKSIRTNLSRTPSNAFEVIGEYMYKDTFEHIEKTFSDNAELFYKVMKVFAIIQNESTDINTICILSEEAYPEVEEVVDILCNFLILEKKDTQYSLNSFAEKYIVDRFVPDAETYNKLSTEIASRQRQVKNSLEQLQYDMEERPKLASIMSDWHIITDIDRITASKMYHLYGEVREACENSGKFKVQSVLENFIKECEESERVTAHPYVKYQKARILQKVDQSNILDKKNTEEIKRGFSDSIYSIKTIDQYAGIQQTKSYASLLWLFGQYLSDLRDYESAMRYLEEAIASFEEQNKKDQEYYQCATKLGTIYLDYYILDQAHRVSYLRKSRAISRMLSINWEHLGKARSYAGQLRTRLSNYGQY